MKIKFITLGCRVNQAETEDWKKRLLAKGYKITNQLPGADFCILNTCAVTALAERKSKRIIRKVLKEASGIKLIVTGCYATLRKREIIKNFPQINLLTNQEKEKIIDQFEKIGPDKNYSPNLRTRALLKIEDGCNNFCHYCIVPYLRGREKSLSYKKVLKKVISLEKEGYKEVVLTGINLGCYQDPKEKVDLFFLIKNILEKTKDIRIRLSSIEPQNFDLKILNLFSSSRLCRHLHLPIQSGSDKILKKMGRPYQRKEIEKLIEKVYQKEPDLALTTDIIVGFPGENEKGFEETIKLLDKIKPAKVHIFRYSSRPLTKAQNFPSLIDEKIKQERAGKLLTLASFWRHNYLQRFIGQELLVLWENKKNGFWQGWTDNYLKVIAAEKDNLANQLKKTKLVKIEGEKILGKLIT